MNLSPVKSFAKLVPNGVTRQVGRTILKTQKNSPTLLVAAGCVGVVATAVAASRATLELPGILEDIQSDVADVKLVTNAKPEKYSEKDRRQAIAYIYLKGTVRLAKLYGPTFILGVSTIAALTSAHRIQNNRIAGLSAAYTAVHQGLENYRKRVANELGEEKERELYYGSEERTVITDDGNGLKKTRVAVPTEESGSHVYAKFFGMDNRNWNVTPEANLYFIRCQQNYLNDLLKTRGHVLLNDAYDILGLDRTPAGTRVGWLWKPNGNERGDNFIDFGIYDPKNAERLHDFMTRRETDILLDFNVDGDIWDQI